MTDSRRKAPAQFLTDAAIRHGVDLMLVSHSYYRKPLNEELENIGLGQAHHRAIYFIRQIDGISPTQLCDYLGVTKQSLSRVMIALKNGGYIAEAQNHRDRRVKNIYLTEEGVALDQRLYEAAKERMKGAYSEAGPDAVEGFWNVLEGLSNNGDGLAYKQLNADRKS